jgi:6-phosphofructokinase 1
MRIGILTGGGDVPGLNPAIKTVVQAATEKGMEVMGIRRGWGGLLEYNPDDPSSREKCILPLNTINTRTIDRTGGTFLHTSRTNPGRVAKKSVPAFLQGKLKPSDKAPHDFTSHVLKNLEKLGIEALVPIGGDDTLSYAARLHREGFHIVAIPKTMDNDVYGTDYCLGFSTAVTRSVEFIHQLRSAIGSHERIAIVELFGRNSGETSLIAGYLAGLERTIISEVPFDAEKLSAMAVEDKRSNPSHYAIIAISEGASMIGGHIVETGQEDAYGHKKLGGIGLVASDAIKKITGEDTLYQQVSYLMRSGPPDPLDLMVASNYARLAVDLISQGASNRLVALRNGTYTSIPLTTISTGEKRVDVEELYDSANYRPRIRNVEGKPMFLY